VETNYFLRILNLFYKASMGPPIYIGGNADLLVGQRQPVIASMGPPIYIGGNNFIDADEELPL